MDLVISPQGHVRCLYNELLDWSEFGMFELRRASSVEPTADGTWTADLSPCGGPILGPYPRRSQALEAEVAWLTKHWLGVNITS